MARVWTTALVIVLIAATNCQIARAQGVFAKEAAPPTGPEFCPPGSPGAQKAYPLTFEPMPLFKNAFDEPAFGHPDSLYYVGIGAVALRRDMLNQTPIAFFDPGVDIPGVPRNVDSGFLPPANAPIAATFQDIGGGYEWGVQFTFAWQMGPNTYELCGFYLPPQTNSGSVEAGGQLDLPFAAFPPPFGFEGNNFMFLQADRVTLALETQLGNAELNRRRQWCDWFEFILGFRYLDVRERMRVFVDDDGIVFQPPDPFRQATIQAQTHSRIAGFQFGFETMHYLVPFLALGVGNKTGGGINFTEIENSLHRGDGFAGPGAMRTETSYAAFTEFNLQMMIWLNQHMRMRFAYHGLWLFNTPEASDQIGADLNNPGRTEEGFGIIRYHGPRMEFQVSW